MLTTRKLPFQGFKQVQIGPLSVHVKIFNSTENIVKTVKFPCVKNQSKTENLFKSRILTPLKFEQNQARKIKQIAILLRFLLHRNSNQH